MKIILPVIAFLLCCSCGENPAVIQTANTELLIPEGIAVDERTQTMYVTSINEHKIISIKPDGSWQDFIPAGSDGFGFGLGIKVEAQSNKLWAVSNTDSAGWKLAMLHCFDMRSKQTLFKMMIRDTANHFFNDLVPDGKGNAYLTATEGGEIFFANGATGKLELLIRSDLTRYPNGIELKNNKLYIATYSNGLLVYDLSAKSLDSLRGAANKQYSFNLDGLGFRGNTLYGVYNGNSVNSNNGVVAYRLNEAGTSVLSEELLLKGHPAYREPTTLSITGNKLYVLANSNLAAYNRNKESVVSIEKTLSPVAVLVYRFD